MGYSGGTLLDPTSGDLGDHTEAVQIDYDPQAIDYEQLLEVFWESHDPTSLSPSIQYQSIVFHHDEEQRQLAEQTRTALEESSGEAIVTDIRPVGAFYRAEIDNQKHNLRDHGRLFGDLSAIYPDDDDLTDSTAAARVNGFLGGAGTAETLCAEIDDYGLSPLGREALLRYAAGRLGECPE